MYRKNYVTVIGRKNAGKTAYLLGMYAALSGVGVSGFTLSAKDYEQDLYLEGLLDELLNEHRLPNATNSSEEYDFHLSYSYSPLIDFTWKDYPGGWIEKKDKVGGWHEHKDEIMEVINRSACVLFIVDGKDICDKVKERIELRRECGEGADNEEDDYRLDMNDSLINASIKELVSDFRPQFNPLTTLCSELGKAVPNVGIVFTKGDAIVDFLCKNEKGKLKYTRDRCKEIYVEFVSSITRVVGAGALFSDKRFVFPMAVSVGREVREGKFYLLPDCVEQPISFAVLNMLLESAKETQRLIDGKEKFLDDTNSWIGRILDKHGRQHAEEAIVSLRKELREIIDNAMKAINTTFHPSASGYIKSKDCLKTEHIPIYNYFEKKFKEIG